MRHCYGFLFIVLLASCQKEAATVRITKGETVDVPFETLAKLPKGMELRWSLHKDGRCPEKAMCPWVGSVVLDLTLSTRSDTHTFQLETNPGELATSIELEGYRIELVNVLPRLIDTLDEEEYVAQLKLSKL